MRGEGEDMRGEGEDMRGLDSGLRYLRVARLEDNPMISAEWLELRIVELSPGMVYLGSNLHEATQLLQAHEEVLAKLQSKQSPVEDLLNQADQLISTQHPRAEVYAAMAESLGLAWKGLNAQLETRKEILDMGVAFHTRAQQYSDNMDAAERVYTDNVMPTVAEGARQQLSALHDHKRAVLESSMYTLQEAQALLARLRGLSAEGATLDSRPLHIKTNIEFTCSQIEHYLESLHDRRRFLDGLFSTRKHHLEQCLALCILYQDLTEAVTALKQLRDEVSQQQGLGESQSNAEILLHEHTKREMAAKEQQDKCIHLLKTAEKMAFEGHYAGAEAKSRAYSVLEAATALHETCDTRTALLNQAILFFRLAQAALTKLDQAEVQVASMGGEGAQRLSQVVGVVEEAVQPALTEGYAILEVTGGRNQPHNMGVSAMVEELERRRSHLSSVCVSSTEQVLQRTELSNAFLEQYNAIESWLVRIGDAFIHGHQDPGGSLSLARDFLHLHQTLSNDVMEKKADIDALAAFLEKLLPDLSPEEGESYQEKMKTLLDHWNSLKKLLDMRLIISEKYVTFHEDAEAVTNGHEGFELLLKDAKDEAMQEEVEAKWGELQKQYVDLCSTGKAYCQDVRNHHTEDPYFDANRAVLCVDTILSNLGKRRLVITDLHSHYQMKITTTKELMVLFNTYNENIHKMQTEMAEMERSFCPLLRGDTADPEGLATTLEQRLNIYVSAVKKTQEDIQNMLTRAEVMSYKGEEGGQRDAVIGSLLQLYQNLQNKATEYQILGHMLIQWCKNIAEIHRSCDKLESQFGLVSLDIGGVEGQLREHEASKQAVMELLKFAQNEADSIISKIKDQCPPEAGSQDINMIEEMLRRRGQEFEMVWVQHQSMLERQLKRSQYHVDLQVISDQLRDLSDQLNRMRGHYGDSLGAALNMQSAFNQFHQTVDMLEKRIQTFMVTTTTMLGPEDDSGEVQEELGELEKKWSTFQMQVGQSRKSIELSIVFYKLVEEAEDWFRQGSKLLVEVAGESANIQNPEQADKLKSRIEHFLHPGEEVQQGRITKISSLALQLYGDNKPDQIEIVSHQNTHMINSFIKILENLTLMAENLKAAEDYREKQKKEKEELAASLAAAQAEAEAARLAAIAAEEARMAAEEVARTMAIPIEPIVPERVEIEIQTEATPLPDEEPPKQEDTPPPKKAKLIDDEPQPMAPIFLTPLVGATVTEGVKFTFECKVIGFPMPEVEWLKDNMSITDNPDYKTSYEEGVCTLTIEETFTEDSALFTCRAGNAAGIAETSASLTVKEAEPVEVLAPPTFTKRLADTTTQEGSSFQLEATVEGHPLPVVSWAKNGGCVDESPDYVITYNNGECVLRFEEVFLEDQAEYSCKASNNLGEDVTKAKLTVTAVEVSEKPKFTMPLSNVMVRAGQKFKLECHVTGLPSPTVTWFHNTKPIKETPDCKISFDGQAATLVMSEAFPKNAGTYTVVAKNSAGEAQCSASVSVKGRIPTETSDSEVTSDIDVEPVKPAVQLALKDTTVKEGKTARLDCVIVGQPEPEVIWYHDDTPVKESSDFKLLFHGDRCSLIIQEAYLEDAGIYRVVAMNSAGEASTACFLTVEPMPELTPSPVPEPPAVAPRFSQLLADHHVTEGKPVTLRASVTGQPKPTIAWFREGQPLCPDNELQIHESNDGSVSLTVHTTTLDHTGQYEVVASNSAGSAKCLAYLSIEPRLPTPTAVEHTEPPVFIKLIEDITVTTGNSAKFEAEVIGVPTPTVSQQQVPLPSDSHSFTFAGVMNGFSGQESVEVCTSNRNVITEVANSISGQENVEVCTSGINVLHINEESSSCMSEVREVTDSTEDNVSEDVGVLSRSNYNELMQKLCIKDFDKQNTQDTLIERKTSSKSKGNKDNGNNDNEDGCDDGENDTTHLSKFSSMKVLDVETYSQLMMENAVVYGSLECSGFESAAEFDQFKKYSEISVLPSEEYTTLLLPSCAPDTPVTGDTKSGDISKNKPRDISKNKSRDTGKDKPGNTISNDGSLTSDEEDDEKEIAREPSQFIDTGLGEEIQPIKLADLWNLIKDKLPDPKANTDTDGMTTKRSTGTFSEEDTSSHRKSLESSDGDLDSGYYSSNFSFNATGTDSSLGSPHSGRSKRNSGSLSSSEEPSGKNSPTEDLIIPASVPWKSGNEKRLSLKRIEKHNLPSDSAIDPTNAESLPLLKDESKRFLDPLVKENMKSLGESMRVCGAELMPIIESGPASEIENDGYETYACKIIEEKCQDAYISVVDVSLDGKETLTMDINGNCNGISTQEEIVTESKDNEEKCISVGGGVEITVSRFLTPELEHVSEYLRCPSSLSVISEESYVSDSEDLSRSSNDTNNNNNNSNKEDSTVRTSLSDISLYSTDSDSQKCLSDCSHTELTIEEDAYIMERKARRAARLAKLKNLTKLLKSPSKMTEENGAVKNKDCPQGADQRKEYDLTMIGADQPFCGIEIENIIDSEFLADERSNANVQSCEQVNLSGEQGIASAPRNGMLFIIKTIDQLTTVDIKRIIVEKLQAVKHIGQQLVRAYVFPFTQAALVDLSKQSLGEQTTSSQPLDSAHSMVFETVLHATRGQGAIVDGDFVDQDVPSLLQAGYYLIYVLFYKSAKPEI
ncbi:hypothetical protein Pcinc_020036 [Petrolisthes cinctipes]|uniref:Ig-like domain-containing protein n=1 Tax=Petrolisthes cinctipes TaxID=88211 RepID=A0AAE1FKD9_PETCI|nr:hypothetical protein Pcinc_020036 [Petrolisthes cinctipes]